MYNFEKKKQFFHNLEKILLSFFFFCNVWELLMFKVECFTWLVELLIYWLTD